MDGFFSISRVLSGSVGSTGGSVVGSSELVADTVGKGSVVGFSALVASVATGWVGCSSGLVDEVSPPTPPPHAATTASVPIASIRRHPGITTTSCY